MNVLSRFHTRYLILACGLILASVSFMGIYIATLPKTLRVAVGAATNEENARIISGLAQLMGRQKESIRLRLITSDNSITSAQALDEGKADLAITRSDIKIPVNGQTVAIWQRNAALFLAPPKSGISNIASLRGHKVGIIRGQIIANNDLLLKILRQYDVAADSITMIPLQTGDIASGLQSGKIDVVFVVGPPAGPYVGEVVDIVTKAVGASPLFVPVKEAEAIALRQPELESMEVVRGTFGGTPPRPSDTLTTLGTSHRLFAHKDLSEDTVAELARLIFTLRAELAPFGSLANRIEAPNTDKGSAIPVHPGATAYVDGEVKTFFERYSDIFYIGAMVISVLGSAVAALIGRATANEQERAVSMISKLMGIMRVARTTTDHARLDDLDHETDEIVATVLEDIPHIGHDKAHLDAFIMALDHTRHVVAMRRKILFGYITNNRHADERLENGLASISESSGALSDFPLSEKTDSITALQDRVTDIKSRSNKPGH